MIIISRQSDISVCQKQYNPEVIKMKRMFILMAVIAITVFAGGCKKEQSSPPLVPQNMPPGGGSIVFNDEIKTLESALKKNPKDLSALIRLGNTYMDTKRYDKAIEMYQRALEIDPKNANVRVDMGTCYRGIGSSDIAVEQYRKVIAEQPNHPNAHLNLGIVLFDDMKQYPEAIKELEKFLEIEPNSPRAGNIRNLVEQLKQQTR
jgi:Tfp pilus assembly protein PilF